MISDVLSWPWIFFVNVPVGVAGVLLTPLPWDESRDASVKSVDAIGAVTVDTWALFDGLRDHPGRAGRVARPTD